MDGYGNEETPDERYGVGTKIGNETMTRTVNSLKKPGGRSMECKDDEVGRERNDDNEGYENDEVGPEKDEI